ncbi:hypothetical protein AGLY_002944 [Aphis glycines]|uniref:Uncharacterized protein n=2 Tax=Aphis TaxID=464929 RepID=A0A6G0U266_APHGL|nr:hypothetical protein AGLY_002944 [Aphis glycines]
MNTFYVPLQRLNYGQNAPINRIMQFVYHLSVDLFPSIDNLVEDIIPINDVFMSKTKQKTNTKFTHDNINFYLAAFRAMYYNMYIYMTTKILQISTQNNFRQDYYINVFITTLLILTSLHPSQKFVVVGRDDTSPFLNQIYQLHVDKINKMFTAKEYALKLFYNAILGVLVYG